MLHLRLDRALWCLFTFGSAELWTQGGRVLSLFLRVIVFVAYLGLPLYPSECVAQGIAGESGKYNPAQSAGRGPEIINAQKELKLYVSSGAYISLDVPGAKIFVADPAIADIQVPSPDRLFVYGKKPGRTTLFALSPSGTQSDVYNIRVSYNTEDLQRFFVQELGDVPVSISESPQGVILNGVVPNALLAERVRAVAARLTGEGNPLINNLRVSGSMQVAIKVRIAEISRTVIKNLGVNWNAVASPGAFSFGLASGRSFLANPASGLAGGITQAAGAGSVSGSQGAVFGGLSSSRANITALVDALETEGLASILAQPTLTAMSGEKASFLAGGEFPIPVTQGQTTTAISVQYQKYGISLDFTPTVLSEELISLYVKPEASELSTDAAVTLNNFQIPSLTTRRTETTVQLGSGESLVIAGLIQNKFSTQIDKLPGAGDVPVLGPLFRSSSFQKNESELIIVVTPYIVRPTTNTRAVRLPTDDLQPPTDLERILQGRLAHTAGQANTPVHIKGDAGFIMK